MCRNWWLNDNSYISTKHLKTYINNSEIFVLWAYLHGKRKVGVGWSGDGWKSLILSEEPFRAGDAINHTASLIGILCVL